MHSSANALQQNVATETAAETTDDWPRRWVLLILGLLAVAVIALHHRQLLHPTIWQDDFQILSASFTWEAVRANFWRAHNEHVMPLGRLSTWLLIQLAGEPTRIPMLAAWHGVMAVLLAMLLLYVFVRRELDAPVYGLVAAALFGISSQYREAVQWFSASFAILALDTLLLALLAAQRWTQAGGVVWLVGCAVAAALAPCWFASGILAGPICALYLLYPQPARPLVRRILHASVPLLGTGVFVVSGLLRNLDHILHLEHWQGKTATEAFDPWVGVVSTVRSLVDNLLLGTFGIAGVLCPPAVVAAGVLVLAVGFALWWRCAPARRLLAVGLVLILSSYWLIYSARAEWGYERATTWGRYQLLSHLGLVLIVAGGLPRLAAQRWARAEVVAVLLAGLLLAQVPRAYQVYEFPRQRVALQFVTDIDGYCQAERITAATARQVLRPLPVEGAPADFDGWAWLRGYTGDAGLDARQARQILPPDWLRPE